MTLLLCDTNFLMKVTTEPLPELAGFLADSGLELVTLQKIETELKGLEQSKNRSTARNARSALRSLDTHIVNMLKYRPGSSEKTDADALLVDFAAHSKNRVVVATLDHSLLSILERKRLPYLTLRNNRPFFRTFESATYLLDKGPK